MKLVELPLLCCLLPGSYHTSTGYTLKLLQCVVSITITDFFLNADTVVILIQSVVFCYVSLTILYMVNLEM